MHKEYNIDIPLMHKEYNIDIPLMHKEYNMPYQKCLGAIY